MRTFVAFAAPTLLTTILVSLLIPGFVPTPLGWPPQLAVMISALVGHHAEESAAKAVTDKPQGQLAPARYVVPPRAAEATPTAAAPADQDVQYPADGVATYVPVTISTTVRLSGTPDVEPVDTSPVTGDGPWPALCGEVVDGNGTPIAGAIVGLASTGASETADAKGLFCMPCPSRRVTVHVSAEGNAGVDYPLQLDGRFTQVRLLLPSAR